jgi:hypothetical protein
MNGLSVGRCSASRGPVDDDWYLPTFADGWGSLLVEQRESVGPRPYSGPWGAVEIKVRDGHRVFGDRSKAGCRTDGVEAALLVAVEARYHGFRSMRIKVVAKVAVPELVRTSVDEVAEALVRVRCFRFPNVDRTSVIGQGKHGDVKGVWVQRCSFEPCCCHPTLEPVPICNRATRSGNETRDEVGACVMSWSRLGIRSEIIIII